MPNQNIRNLRDLEATRANIISGIQALGSDDRIKKDSPIFIFYAGHGATSLHLHSELQYEVLCPSDVTIHSEPTASNLANEKISGIPDYEVQRLINEVTREKGNNIVHSFCCLLFVFLLTLLFADPLSGLLPFSWHEPQCFRCIRATNSQPFSPF